MEAKTLTLQLGSLACFLGSASSSIIASETRKTHESKVSFQNTSAPQTTCENLTGDLSSIVKKAEENDKISSSNTGGCIFQVPPRSRSTPPCVDCTVNIDFLQDNTDQNQEQQPEKQVKMLIKQNKLLQKMLDRIQRYARIQQREAGRAQQRLREKLSVATTRIQALEQVVHQKDQEIEQSRSAITDLSESNQIRSQSLIEEQRENRRLMQILSECGNILRTIVHWYRSRPTSSVTELSQRLDGSIQPEAHQLPITAELIRRELEPLVLNEGRMAFQTIFDLLSVIVPWEEAGATFEAPCSELLAQIDSVQQEDNEEEDVC